MKYISNLRNIIHSAYYVTALFEKCGTMRYLPLNERKNLFKCDHQAFEDQAGMLWRRIKVFFFEGKREWEQQLTRTFWI